MTTTTSTRFRELPLPERMRLAAEVLEEAGQRLVEVGVETNLYQACKFDPSRLRIFADRWDKTAKQAEELSQTLRTLSVHNGWREIAQALLDAGWTKE